MKQIVLLLACTILACDQPSESGGELKITFDAHAFIIRNQTHASVYYDVFEKNSLALIDWIPTCDASREIRSSDTARIALTPDSFKPSNVAVIFWWHECGPNGGGIRLKSMEVSVR